MAVKRILRYLKGTEDYGLWYKLGENIDLKVFTNVDWVGNIDDRKSTSGGAFFLGKRLVSWTSKKQNCTSQSTAEAEYVVAAVNCSNIVLVVGIVARFLTKPRENHMMAIKRILRYLKGTKDYGLWYKLGGNLDLKVFIDVD